ncbi:hypothetical protein F4780DRAFT_80044 [Xylariomycetidae sp. FL0641]|nr:hypothetical protein F4780DRAFT_80044 [Xylariomycetidae sp. FL0641]
MSAGSTPKRVSAETAQAITSKKARYARYADLKAWEAFAAEVAYPEATYDYQDASGSSLVVGGRALKFESTAAFFGFIAPFFAPLQTLHNIGPGDFSPAEHDDDDEVDVVFGFEDQLLAPPLGAWAEIRGGGYYYETWKRDRDGDWKLLTLKMRRTYQKMTTLVAIALWVQDKLGVSLM